MIGKQISHYRITAELGCGGMGKIYKAEDIKLNRTVSLKFLSASFSSNENFKKRFLLEAQSVSALDHPNICAIYDIGETEEGELFFAMPYYQGETLKDRISHRKIEINELEDILIQLCEGLNKAHECGIIHRDIKPANIFITNSGIVKILDFGIAKVKLHTQITSAVSAIGTTEYMSPEQLKGEEIDQGTDIWSLGVVIYEILTGEIPFKGDYDQAVIYSIINEEPDFNKIQDNVLRAVVKKCLEKEKENRYKSVKDLADDLVNRNSLQSLNGLRKKYLRKAFITIAVLAVSGIITALYLILFNSKEAIINQAPMKTVRLTSYAGEEYDPAFSPDGKSIAFSWNGPLQDNFDIYIKLIDAGNPIRLTSNALVDNKPEWSPDGHFIAFVRETRSLLNILPREIYIIPSTGGTEQKIAEYNPGHSSQPSLCWSTDSRYIFFSSWAEKKKGFEIFKVSVETRKIEEVTSLPVHYWGDQSAVVSPDGERIAFIRSRLIYRSDIYIKNFKDNIVRRITEIETVINGLTWSNDSRSVILASNIDGTSALWKVDINDNRLEKIESGININNPCLSADGKRLVFAETVENSSIWKIDLQDPENEKLLIGSSAFDNMNPDISNDGKRIVFSSNRTGIHNIWICENDGSNPAQLTNFEGEMFYGIGRWSPDNCEVLICFIDSVYLLNVQGGILRNIGTFHFPIWSENGLGIYAYHHPDLNIYLYSKDGRIEKKITGVSGVVPFLYGSYIYFLRDWNSREIWRTPVNGGDEEPVLQGFPDLEIGGWVVAKKGIYFIRSNNGSPVLDFYNLATKKVSKIRNVPMFRIAEQLIEISPDERYLLYSKQEPRKSDIILIENFRTKSSENL